ncbi:MAG TPA: exonuclease SbcCD subunit D [Clostridiaceae bacterium]|nr:exonuclease SbcCD subunit D [Clostridiaceae bacterium]
MRILHTSDWHLGRMLENINRIDEQKQFIDELCYIADHGVVDLVLVAGDIFDTYNPSSAAEELFYNAVERLNDGGKRAVIVIAGNHDSPERLCAASALAYKNGIILLGYPASDPGAYKVDCENINLVESGPGWMEINIKRCEHNAVLLTLPYPSESRLEQILSIDCTEEGLQQAYADKIGSIFARLGCKFRDDTVNLVTAHIFLRGGKESESERTLQVGGAMTVDPCSLPSNAHYAALGHLHRPQEVKNASCPAYYSGSPLAYSFSEADYCKAVYIVEAFPGKEAKIEEVFLNCGRPLRKWSAKNGIEEALRWCEEGRDCNAWIDLEIYTDRVLTMEEQKLLRELNQGIINIRPVIKCEIEEVIEYENREGKKIDELFREYYKFKTGTEISEELMEAFLEIINTDEEENGGEDIASEVS